MGSGTERGSTSTPAPVASNVDFRNVITEDGDVNTEFDVSRDIDINASEKDTFCNYYAEIFERWAGLFISLTEPKKLLNNVILKSNLEPKKPNHDGRFEVDYISLRNDRSVLWEVKSGTAPFSTYQFMNYTSTHRPVRYFLRGGIEDRFANAYKKVYGQDLAESPVQVFTPSYYPFKEQLENSHLGKLMSDRDFFLKYIKKIGIEAEEQNERMGENGNLAEEVREKTTKTLSKNLLSITHSIQENPDVDLESLTYALEAAYSDNPTLKSEAEEFGYEWLNKRDYRKMCKPNQNKPLDPNHEFNESYLQKAL